MKFFPRLEGVASEQLTELAAHAVTGRDAELSRLADEFIEPSTIGTVAT